MMRHPSKRLTDADRAQLVTALTSVQRRLDDAGEMLASVHIAHALDCLEAKSPSTPPVSHPRDA